MNLVIMEVLPTDWSPRKTSLNFCDGVTRGELLGEFMFDVGVQ
jgi:hypothetical protein